MAETDHPALEWLRLLSRDKSDTFFSCLATIFASTYLGLHLNVPKRDPARRRSCLTRGWPSLRRHLGWAALVVMAPELLVCLAFGDWRAASVGLAVLQKLGHGENRRSWTRAHASYANMGGLGLRMEFGGQKTPAWVGSSDEGVELVVQEYYRRTMVGDLRRALRTLAGRLSGFLQHLVAWVTGAVLYLGIKRITEVMLGWRKWWQRLPVLQTQGAGGIGQEAIELTARGGSPGGVLENGQDVPALAESSSSARPPSVDLGQVRLIPKAPARKRRAARRRPTIAIPSVAESSASRQITAARRRMAPAPGGSSAPASADGTRGGTVVLYLNTFQIAAAQRLGVLGEVPNIAEDEMDDKSKTSGLSKAYAAAVLSWFALRIAVQLYNHGVVTQLELASSTYVACALAAYLLHLSKPQGVELPQTEGVSPSATVRPVTEEDIEDLRELGGSPFLVRNFWPPFGLGCRPRDPREPIATGTSLTACAIVGRVLFFDDDLIGIVAGSVFGGLYCLGWNQAFPSAWEQRASRAAAVIITASLIPYSVANTICSMVAIEKDDKSKGDEGRGGGGQTGRRTHAVHRLVLYTLLAVYLLCRLFMLAVMVRAFFML